MANEAVLYSSLGADPDLGELVEMFVDEMPERIDRLKSACKDQDLETLTTTAHQLKGAAGSYGFDQVTPYAKRLETAARDGECQAEILESLNELVTLCGSLRAGVPTA